ncbi:hypothetical protein KC669_01910 [Candidatus Dojkabacteria bacterium]|uniref:Ribulose-phosphate 3-epimerase n=1 Tax=Candidatus Dojkabacteria bacterium TaxID=2099670 RepID=A0A955LAN2_9BACT|nr:hypothetical protein [Candidatus Dojkabacteria bacterium]
MIEISPAVLVNSEAEIEKELLGYSKLFKQVDIDINVEGDDFAGDVTLDVKSVLEYCTKYSSLDYTFHLMVSEPLSLIELILKEWSNAKFIIHQEANFEPVAEKLGAKNLGICIKAESKLKDIEFYKQFKEVQLMTIVTGKQGNPFKKEILDRVEWLRESGYQGIISLDGSINLNSAQLIRNYDVNRVSVGSFFSKAENIELNKQKLELALNL